MRILMAGVSGFLGSRLVDRLTADGHQVTRLVRRAPRKPDERRWNPSAAQLDPQVVADADAVMNLAGAGVGDKRWNDEYKGLIRSSRVDSTTTLAITIAGLPAADRPRCCSTPPPSAGTATPATGRSRRTRRPARGSWPTSAGCGRRPPARPRTPASGWSGCAPGYPSTGTAACSSRCCCRSGWASAASWATAGSGCRGYRWGTGWTR